VTDDSVDASELELFELVQLVPGQGEDEGDVDDGRETFAAGIGGKDWTVETLVSQMRKGRIDLDPSFQRRNAWLDNRKSQLIESIALGFPIPQIVLAERLDKAGHFFVLDGKQRLLALRQFFASPGDERDIGFEPLKLSALEVLQELNGKTVSALDIEGPDLLAAIENHTIRTVVLNGWNSEKLLLSLFLRLNTGSVSLSPQELRQALINGSFMEWLDKTSGELPALRELLGSPHPDRRMVDAELLLRHLAFWISPVVYRGNLKAFLDESSRCFNNSWTDVLPSVESGVEQFALAVGMGLQGMGEKNFGRKWRPGDADHDGHFERALNRAVLDFQVYSLCFSEVRDGLAGNFEEVSERFRNACETDEGFVRSISLTTKTADAFRVRHSKWQTIVYDVCKVDYPLPKPLTASRP
jgi:hypothetical protein